MTLQFDECVKAAGGTQKQLAEVIGITEQAVGKWKNKKIPVERVIQIEKSLGLKRDFLRPDIYPPELDAA